MKKEFEELIEKISSDDFLEAIEDSPDDSIQELLENILKKSEDD